MTQPIFNADAMEEIRKTVRESQRGVRSTGSHQGRWHKKGGGGGTEMIIQFRITSSDFCDSCTVKGRVLAIPVGASIASLPDIDTYDNDSVTIYDKSGCFFNEPEEDLLNRIGFAHRLNFLEDGPCANTLGELWAVTSLCCDDLDCSDLTT